MPCGTRASAPFLGVDQDLVGPLKSVEGSRRSSDEAWPMTSVVARGTRAPARSATRIVVADCRGLSSPTPHDSSTGQGNRPGCVRSMPHRLHEPGLRHRPKPGLPDGRDLPHPSKAQPQNGSPKNRRRRTACGGTAAARPPRAGRRNPPPAATTPADAACPSRPAPPETQSR
jgi:hypothetical protein